MLLGGPGRDGPPAWSAPGLVSATGGAGRAHHPLPDISVLAGYEQQVVSDVCARLTGVGHRTGAD